MTDQPTASPVEVATAFVEAYGAFDIEQATLTWLPMSTSPGLGRTGPSTGNSWISSASN